MTAWEKSHPTPSAPSLKRLRVRCLRPVIVECGRDGVCLTGIGAEAEVPRTPFWLGLVENGVLEIVAVDDRLTEVTKACD